MKKTIITILFAIVAMAGQAQTKTAIIKGYSPMLKNGTEAVCTIDMVRVATDTVHAGNFILNVPVEKLTECKFYLEGEGCPNFIKTIFIAQRTSMSGASTGRTKNRPSNADG